MHDTTVSEYIRACILIKMVIDGEVEALRIIGRTIGMKAMDAMKKRQGSNLLSNRTFRRRETNPVRAACRKAAGQSGMAPSW